MDLVLVLGPMKSGKSLELVSLLSPLRFSTVRHRIYQSDRHVRDSGVTSRSGGALETTKTTSLDVALHEPVDVVGVDEVHMFDVADIAAVGRLLDRGTKVVVAGIDLDHRGELFAPVRALLAGSAHGHLPPGRVRRLSRLQRHAHPGARLGGAVHPSAGAVHGPPG